MIDFNACRKRIIDARGKQMHEGQCYLELHESAAVQVAQGKNLLFGCSWLSVSPFVSVMALRRNASIHILDNFKIFEGSEIYINNEATLTLGSGYINSHASIHCFTKINIGFNVAIADHVTIRDSDNHIIHPGSQREMSIPVTIGNKVWIGTRSIILKGVEIGDNSIIAAGSVVTKSIPPSCLAAGCPARVVREGVSWE